MYYLKFLIVALFSFSFLLIGNVRAQNTCPISSPGFECFNNTFICGELTCRTQEYINSLSPATCTISGQIRSVNCNTCTASCSCPSGQIVCNNACQNPNLGDCASLNRVVSNQCTGDCGACRSGYTDCNGTCKVSTGSCVVGQIWDACESKCVSGSGTLRLDGSSAGADNVIRQSGGGIFTIDQNGKVNVNNIFEVYISNGFRKAVLNNSDLYFTTGKAIRVDKDNAQTNLKIGNWGQGRSFVLDVEGGINIDSNIITPLKVSGRRSDNNVYLQLENKSAIEGGHKPWGIYQNHDGQFGVHLLDGQISPFRINQNGLIIMASTTSFMQNVGIGTATPSERLHVVGGAKISNFLDVTNAVTGGWIHANNTDGFSSIANKLIIGANNYDTANAINNAFKGKLGIVAQENSSPAIHTILGDINDPIIESVLSFKITDTDNGRNIYTGLFSAVNDDDKRNSSCNANEDCYFAGVFQGSVHITNDLKVIGGARIDGFLDVTNAVTAGWLHATSTFGVSIINHPLDLTGGLAIRPKANPDLAFAGIGFFDFNKSPVVEIGLQHNNSLLNNNFYFTGFKNDTKFVFNKDVQINGGELCLNNDCRDTWPSGNGNDPLTGPAGGDLTGTYPNPTIANNAVTTVKIADSAVTTAKITNSAVTTDKIANNAINTAKIVDGAITANKLDKMGATNGQFLGWNGTAWSPLSISTSSSPTGNAGGDLTGNYPNPTIANNAINTAKIVDGAVTTAKIADNAITTNKISNNAITANKINVTNSKLLVGGGANGVITPNLLHWDNANSRLGIGNSSPQAKLQINQFNGEEGLRIVSSDFSPLVIRSPHNDRDLFRVDQNGVIYLNNGTFIRGSFGGQVTAVGRDALRDNTTGGQNAAFGWQSLLYNTTGSNNSAFGSPSLRMNTTGKENSAFGHLSLFSNTSGNNNSAFGVYALSSNTSGNNNSAFGMQALEQLHSSSVDNIGIGINVGGFSGRPAPSDPTPGRQINSVFIGNETKAGGSNQSNQIVIGHQAIGAGSNSVTLGNNLINKTILRGNVEISGSGSSLRLNLTNKGTCDNNRRGLIAYENGKFWGCTANGWRQLHND